MHVDCEGCAGCCIDWRALTTDDIDHERRGPFEPLDDTYNLVPLTRDEVRAFVEEGYGDALQPRLWRASDDRSSVTLGGIDVAAIDGRPVFFVGLRKPPKPVAPFDSEQTWLPACVFLDSQTLQCRIHDEELYPQTCGSYPGENLLLDVETECERVEQVHGGTRLLDDEPPDGVEPLFGPAAIGTKLFAHPDPERIADSVERFRDGTSTAEDRAEFVAVAAASSPGTLVVNDPWYERVRETVLETESWVGRAIGRWTDAAGPVGDRAPPDAPPIDERAGAPPTPGWVDADSDS